MEWSDENIVKTLTKGGIVVMPTDTLYGIVGRAEDPKVVERVYTLRKRHPDKPCIVLIGDISELGKFSINLGEKEKILGKYWPGPVSIILDSTRSEFSYLDRGTKTLAFRVPGSRDLRALLLQVGPLIAPSANLEGEPPAQNIEEAKKYFGDLVDLYVDGGEIRGTPSRVIKLGEEGEETVIRP